MQCKKCEKTFPSTLKIEGKIRNLCNRKYCFECSPFKQHNTKKLKIDNVNDKVCNDCGKTIIKTTEKKGKICWTCRNKKYRLNAMNNVRAIMGGKCLICGYNQCPKALDCHHVDPSSKNFDISGKFLQLSWDKIEVELRKCIMLCCRCHREVHCEFIPKEKIHQLWIDFWGR